MDLVRAWKPTTCCCMCHVSTHNTFFWAYFWWIMALWSRWVPLHPICRVFCFQKVCRFWEYLPLRTDSTKTFLSPSLNDVEWVSQMWQGKPLIKKNCLTWDTPKGRSHKDWDLGSVVAIPDHGLLFGSPLFRQTLGQGDEDSCSWCGKHSDLIWSPLAPIWSVRCIPFICQFLYTSAH